MIDEIKQAIDPVLQGIEAFNERLDKNQPIIDDYARRRHTLVPSVAVGPLGAANYGGFEGQLKCKLADNFGSIQQVSKIRPFSLEFKDMTTASSITGSMPRLSTEPGSLPSQIFNFRDLVRLTPTSSGLLVLPRETAPTGSASRVPETGTKPSVDAKFTMINYTADYIAATTKISKQMLQDLAFLQSWLPTMLIREFYKAENKQFYGDLSATATGSSTTSATIYAEKVLDWIGNLGAGNFAPNAVITTFPQYIALLKTIPSGGSAYSVPGGITIGSSGEIRIAGITVRPANWITSGKTLVGDFSQASIAVADTLKVEFFEQDGDNVQKNMITVRCEARECLIIEQTDAFIHA